MATRKLYAKDRRKLKRRRWTSVAMTVGGGAALIFFGWYLYRKIVADATPAPGQQKDWSGCLTPPDWVQPRPAFSCGQRVTSEALYNYGEPGSGVTEAGIDGWVTDRNWSNGMWTYGVFGSDMIFEERDLTEA